MKVNCPKCNCAYKVDDNRVKPGGLKMRCPKCSQSFRVLKNGSVDNAPSKTLISTPDPNAVEKGKIQSIRPKRPVPPKPAVSKPAAPKPAVPKPGKLKPDKPPRLPKRPTAIDKKKGPAKPLKTMGGAVDEQGGQASEEHELQLNENGAAVEKAGNAEFDLSSAEFDLSEQNQEYSGEIHLPPIPKTDDEPLPISSDGTDRAVQTEDDPFGDIDLPSSEDSAKLAGQDDDDPFGSIDLPPPGDAAAVPAETDAIDLPAPFGAVDLPEPIGAVDLPKPSSNINLPTPGGNVDLPAADLSAPAGNVDLSKPAGGVDLPSPAGVVDLPSPAGVVDLPSPAGVVDLPSPIGAFDLPSMTDASELVPSDTGIGLGQPSNGDTFGSIDLSPQTAGAGNERLPMGHDGTDEMNPAPLGETGFGELSPDILPPLGATMGSDVPGFQGGLTPSVPDLSAPSASDEAFGAVDNTQDGDLGASRVKASGTTNFGEVDLGPDPTQDSAFAPPLLDDEEGEFADFPTQDAADSGTPGVDGDHLELATDPMDFDASGTLVDEPVGRDSGLEDSERRPAVNFSGRRKFERQSRRVKLLLLAALGVIIIAGAGMALTPLGPFGAYALVKLLPSSASDKIIHQTQKSVAHHLTSDTFLSLTEALKEIDQSLKQVPDNEDLRLLGVYAHYWHEVRFGRDKKHDHIASKLLGSINLSESESPYAPLAKASQLLRTGKTANIAQALKSPANTTANGLSLIVAGYLGSGSFDKAVVAAKRLETKEKSARSGFLLARALVESGVLDKAAEKLNKLIAKYPKHTDSILALIELLERTKPVDHKRIIELAERIVNTESRKCTKAQRAQAHALLGHLHLMKRHSDEAAAEFVRAENLNSDNVSMLIGKGEIALDKDDLSTAAVSFNKATAEEPNNIFAILGSIETTLREGNLSDAKEALLKVLPKNERNAKVHYLMGRVQWALKKMEEVEKEFKIAIELNKEYLKAYISLSQFYLSLKKDKEAMVILDDASEAVPNSPLINQTLADAQAIRGDYDAAIVELSKALDLDPDNTYSHFRMAQMYRRLGSFEDAARSLAEVEKRNAKYPGMALEQGLLMEDSGDVEKALASYKKALSESEDDANLKVRVAAASHILGDDVTAEKLLSEAIEVEPRSPEINFYLGEVYRISGRTTEAVVPLKIAAELDKENPLYHLRYGMILRDMRNGVEAMEEYRTAKQLDPKLAEVHVRIGELQLAQGTARDAIVNIDKGLSLDPMIADGYQLIAEAFEQLSDLRSAVAYYRRAITVLPDNAKLFFKLGLVELRIRGNRAAAGSLARAVALGEKLDPLPSWLPEALYRLGVAQRAQGKRANAITSFKRYLEIAPENHIDRTEVIAHLDRLGG
ncbi:MAG: tetratricopeptide repeat protein [Proteobacteria bacterium]|nr:tetratricopeptide repeat protein [Pseudomonadota bacterium]